MQLTLLIDHRFHREADGRITSPKSYSPKFFADRYLRVFDHIRVVGRVDDGLRGRVEWGPGVTFESVGNWNSMLSWWRQRAVVREIVRDAVTTSDAVIGVAPGVLASLASNSLGTRPLALEVVGDPHGSLAPGTVRHVARPLLRMWAVRSLQALCRRSVATSYVTTAALQHRYPGGPHTRMFGCSDVELPDDSFSLQAWTAVRNPERGLTLVNVGTMSTTYKRQDLLMEAVAGCRQRGHNIALKLVGDGQYRPELEAQANRLGIRDHVEFLGMVPAGPAVRQQLDQSDIFVMPSMTEGCPRALLEAMARGLPCLGSRVGGIPDLLPEDCLFPAGSSTALETALLSWITDSTRLRQAAVRNHEFAADFHNDRLDQVRLEFYQAVADANGARSAPLARRAA